MDLTAMFVEPFISQLVEKLNLAPRALSLIPYGGVDGKLREQWRKALLIFQGALPNAEERCFSNDSEEEASVKQWVHDVQKLAYEIDDFNDKLDFNARHRQVTMDEPESSRPRKLAKKLLSGFSLSSLTVNITRTNDENRMIDDIADRMEELVKKMNTLGLDGRQPIRRRYVRLPTTSFTPNLIFGRQEETTAIISLLLQEDRMLGERVGNFRVISIVGMPGIGKTTLAQSLYNNQRVKERFPLRVWVSAPENFDVVNISEKIYEGLYRKKCPYINNLDMVHQELVEKLSIEKFLLVLDGVWNESTPKWDLLCEPFRTRPFETVIIVTTRSHIIATDVRSEKVFDVNLLSDGDCLSLLAQHALQTPNFNGHQDLKEVGEVIAERCKGSPLAAKSMGDLLHRRGISLRHWIEVSTSRIWELLSNDIKYDLSRSYHHLPRHLKPLFLYCSILPKGYAFDKQEIVMLWMAQGFLGPLGVETQMDELGFEYFDQLKSRSVFQCSTGESSFIMDDLTSDLAQFVAGVMCFRLEDIMVKDEVYKVADEARHASFNYNRYYGLKKFKVFKEVPGLRTLLLIQESTMLSYVSGTVLNDLLPTLRCLRSLSFGGCHISEVPKSLADLKLLRYLDLSRTDITKVPEFVSHLYNLQTLLLHSCPKLVQLPTSIKNLIDLRHLNIVDTPKLEKMPLGIGTLTHLRTLSKFIVDKSYGREITELKSLHHLKGTLSIIGMENVMSVQDAILANLLGKEDLQELKMKWSSCSNGSARGGGQPEYKVLNALKPQKDLASLEIESYGGQIFPTWIGDRLFCKMVKVRLIGCKNVTKLPSLGQLTSLKELFIEGMVGVKGVREEFLGTGPPYDEAFPSLVILSFTNMNGWEEWFSDFSGAFPCLKELQVSGCLRLNTVSLPSIPSLEILKLQGCMLPVLTNMVEQLGSIKNLELRNISGLSVLDEEIIRCLKELQDLSVCKCEKLIYFWREEVACGVLEKIKSLTIKDCQQLETMGVNERGLLPHNLECLELENCNNLEKMPNLQNNHISLRRLTIKDCKKLQNMPSTTYFQQDTENHETMDRGQSSGSEQGEYEFSNLEAVSIYGCPSLHFFPTGKKLPRTLRDLSVGDCKNMEEPEEGETWMSSRKSNCFESWLNLKHLAEGFAHVTRLVINSCQGIESIPEKSLSHTLVSLVISNCSNLKLMLCQNEMPNLKYLRELTIIGCRNLERYPCGGRWPPNLESLTMGDVKQPIAGWGLAMLPASLHTLGFDGDFPQLVSFLSVGILLPTTSLTSLQIRSLKNLKSLRKGLENLSSLQHLLISSCPMLRELPETLLSSLSSLEIDGCLGVKKRCKKGKKDYWPKISHIPCLKIDGILMCGL